MFGTLRYDAQNDDTHFIERTTGSLNGKCEGQRPRYSACDKCRAKKVCMHVIFKSLFNWLTIFRVCSKNVVAGEKVVNDAYVP